MSLFKKPLKKILTIITGLLLSAPVWAAGTEDTNPLYNPLTILLICVMIILLFAIGVLGNILTGSGEIILLKWKKKKEDQKKSPVTQVAAMLAGLMLISSAIFAQGTPATTPAETPTTIGGLTPAVFYIMVSVIFIELLVILVLLINVRLLVKSQKESLVAAPAVAKEVVKKQKVSWWGRFNKLKPIEEEADLDLGHDYDGIRELNNRLPPWWLYGFYLTIVFAAVYLWRYHVAHSAPLSREEYEIAVQKADQRIKEYLKEKGDAVNENTVTMLGATDITEGKKLFETTCVVCHNAGGAGNIGPNLTDDYWLHGGDIKSVFKTIKYGINAMPTWQNTYSNKQIAQLASYVKSLHGTNPANAKTPQGELYKEDMSNSAPAADSTAPKKENKVASN